MKGKVFYILLLLGILLFFNRMQAQGSNEQGRNTLFTGVKTSQYSAERYNATSSPILLDTIYSFPTPGSWPSGLTWDGHYFWTCDASSALMYKLTTTGEVVSSFQLPDGAFGGGLAWDGNHICLADEDLATLFKLDTTNGSVVAQFNLPSFGSPDPNGFGLAWDGQYFWHSQYGDSAKIFKLDPQNGQIISSFIPHTNRILGIIWINGFIYGVDLSVLHFYRFDPLSGAILDSIGWDVPFPLGLTWDGQSFWNVSGRIAIGGTQRIYEVNSSATPVAINTPNKVDSFIMYPNNPNPFNQMTTIRYTIPMACDVNLLIYNQLGQKVRELVNERQTTGTYWYQWDGKNERNEDVVSSIYFYRIIINQFAESRRMLLQR